MDGGRHKGSRVVSPPAPAAARVVQRLSGAAGILCSVIPAAAIVVLQVADIAEGGEKFMKPPQIQTERLSLRSLQPGDAEVVYSYRALPEVYAFQAWRPGSVTEVREYITRLESIGFNVPDTWFQMGIYLRSNGQLVGDTGLHFLAPDNQQVEIGFTTAPAHQRHGYAFEAVGALIACLFDDMGKHRIVGSVDPRNAASIGLLEKLGMRREGLFRSSVNIRDRWEDDVVYAILREEWATSKPDQGHSIVTAG